MGFTAPSCVCNTNYTGDNCSTLVCPGYPNNICNKRGYCSDANGSPQCFCTTGYDGDGCQNETNYNTTIGSDTNANDTNDETTTMEAPCPGPMCNGHGNCSQGLCSCENFWSGLSCGERDCPKVNGLQCSNRGICIGNDTYSYCNCTIAGWIEDDCGTVNTSYCPNNCSGQTCNTHDVPFCECGHGLEGVDCGIRNSSSIQSGPSDLATWQLVLIIAGAAVVGLIVLTLILVFAIPTLRFAVFPKLKIRNHIKKSMSHMDGNTNAVVPNNPNPVIPNNPNPDIVNNNPNNITYPIPLPSNNVAPIQNNPVIPNNTNPVVPNPDTPVQDNYSSHFLVVS